MINWLTAACSVGSKTSTKQTGELSTSSRGCASKMGKRCFWSFKEEDLRLERPSSVPLNTNNQWSQSESAEKSWEIHGTWRSWTELERLSNTKLWHSSCSLTPLFFHRLSANASNSSLTSESFCSLQLPIYFWPTWQSNQTCWLSASSTHTEPQCSFDLLCASCP